MMDDDLSYQRTFNEVLTISGDGMGRAEISAAGGSNTRCAPEVMSIALETEECDRIWRTIISSHRRTFNEVLTISGDSMGRAEMDIFRGGLQYAMRTGGDVDCAGDRRM